MKRIGMSSLVVGAVLLSSVCSAAPDGKQKHIDPWKQPVSVELTNVQLSAALQEIVKDTEISYIIDPDWGWRNVSASLRNTPVADALHQVMRVAGVPYRVDGKTLIVCIPGSSQLVRSVSAKFEARVVIKRNDEEPIEHVLSSTNSGAEGSGMTFQNRGAFSIKDSDGSTLPGTSALSVQLMPSFDPLELNMADAQASLTGMGNLSMSIPYWETVTTVVGNNVVTNKVARFISVARNFSMGGAVPLDVPTVVAEGTDSTKGGSVHYIFTVTLSVSKEDNVRRTSGAWFAPAGSDGGFGASDSSGTAAPPEADPAPKTTF